MVLLMGKKKHFILIIFICAVLCFIFVSYNGATSFFAVNINALANSNTKSIKDYKSFYNQVKESMINYDSTLVVNVAGYDKNTYNLDVVKKVLEDNPELKGNFTNYNLKVVKSLFSTKLTFNFKYFESKTVIENREKAVQSKVKDIISSVIKSNMKDYEKEAALHDYIVNNTKYDIRFSNGKMPKESYTAYGVLIDGVGVCQGYAQAMDRLLTSCGIENMMVTGEANDGSGWVGHAWNIVKIAGKYYELDTTWDDPITKDGSNKLRHSYFNVTDEELSKNHKWDRKNYPACDETAYSFDNLNLVEKDSNGNTITVVKNYNEFYEAVKKTLVNKTSTAAYRIGNYDDHPNNIKYWIGRAYEDLNVGGKYQVNYYKDDMLKCAYVTVNFQR